MARARIVVGTTAVGAALDGPVQVHGARSYSLMAGDVKAAGGMGVSEPGDGAVQIVLVGTLDFRGDDLADLQGTAARQVHRTVDLRRVGL
jgi:hypothetical protein